MYSHAYVFFAAVEKLRSMDLFGSWMHVFLSKFMRRQHGKMICEWLAIVLFGVELLENYRTLMEDLNIWNFLLKALVFLVGVHSAHSVFLQMSLWSHCDWPASPVGKRLPLQHPVQRWWKRVRPTQLGCSCSFHKSALNVLANQLPLPLMVVLATFHSVSGTYFFYKLTGRQYFIIKGEESMLYAACVSLVDGLAILTVLLWFRWTMAFYGHEASEMQQRVKEWHSIFNSRWQYIALCTAALSCTLLVLAGLRLVHQVPYLNIEMIDTAAQPYSWFFYIFLVTIITFLGCFPHGVSQLLSIFLTFAGYYSISAGEAEIHGEVYGIIYFLVPGSLAVAALAYYTCFSPNRKKGVEPGKLASVVLATLLVLMMGAVMVSEAKAFNQYTKYPSHE